MNRQRQIWLLFSFFISCSFTSFGQINVDKIELFKELEGTIITDITHDRKGNIWIATQGGLVKFDGYEFTWYHNDPNDERTIGSLLTYEIEEDSKGKIWIGCMESIYAYNPENRLFKAYDLDSNFPMNGLPAVSTIANDGNGRIYFGVNSGNGMLGTNALLYYDEQLDQIKGFEEEAGLSIRDVFFLLPYDNGKIFFVSTDGPFVIDKNHQLHPISTEMIPALEQDEFVYEVEASEDGTIWFTTNQSKLYSLNFNTQEKKVWHFNDLFNPGSKEVYPSSIAIDNYGSLIIANEIGLIKVNTATKQIQLIELAEKLSFNISGSSTLHFDMFNNLWLGISSEGLIKISNKKTLKSYTHNPDDPHSIAEGWISRICEIDNRTLIFPNNDQGGFKGINQLDLETGLISKMPYTEILPDFQWVFMINEIQNGEILFASNKGCFVYNSHNGEVKDYNLINDAFDSVFIHNAHRDADGYLWLCTFSGLFKEHNGLSTYFDFSQEEGSPISNEVTKVYESKNHGIWALTNDGLFSIDRETEIVTRHGNDSIHGQVFVSQDINSLAEDTDGNIWVGTWQGGLHKYNLKSGMIKHYGVSDGISSSSIQGILYDVHNNSLWLSTFAGMSNFFIKEEQFINYSQEDGIQGRLFADGAYQGTSSGLFVFGGSSGITIINPNNATQESIPPLIQITDFNVGNYSYPIFSSDLQYDFETAIAFDQNNISIKYVGIHYDKPSKNKFIYKLENYENEWRKVGDQRAAYYYNLPHGKYNFKVKSANSNGVWNEEPASISFTITPPWWLTWWAYSCYGFLFIAGVFAVDKIQRKRLVSRERRQAQEKELAQAKEIEKAYTKLKATQTQLIHSEKMASLGELTAGIAHEIQNPLNFVNNFAEVSVDLIEELKEEKQKPNKSRDKDLEEEILLDVIDNLGKINHHGQRASSIVKGMLEHSRTGKQEKEPANLNSLADEYLRLAYHGLRAKDKSFSAEFKSELYENLPEIRVIVQDIGRVLLNLINNAFYACSERSKNDRKDYRPQVIVSTKLNDNTVEVSVEDNAGGIKKDVLDKIFQPFFTTKPTGEGTGLGLSLSYDIITKGHDGNLDVETEEGSGTRFIIKLPIN